MSVSVVSPTMLSSTASSPLFRELMLLELFRWNLRIFLFESFLSKNLKYKDFLNNIFTIVQKKYFWA